MPKKIILFLFLVVAANTFSQRFTLEQKLKDFEYMYKVLNENYPYFGINKRKYNTDWLANKEKYIERIKNTKNDREYFNTLYDALGDLHSGHADFWPTLNYGYAMQCYTNAAKNYSWYKPWKMEMQKPTALKYQPYWGKMLNPEKPVVTEEKESTPQKVHYYPFSTGIIEQNRIAYLKIPSLALDYNNVASFGDSIRRFLLNVKDYPNLIIDIQGNEGGDSRFWSDSIVPYLLAKTVKQNIVIAQKKGNYVRHFMNWMLKQTKSISYRHLSERGNCPPELKDENFRLLLGRTSFNPNKPVGFEGKIFLLVDRSVFSSAEMFTVFAKTTKWATVAGENTSGDGIGSTPIVVTLPETGLIFRFPGAMGLNADGSANDEFGTSPDVRLDGADANERLSQLVKYIQTFPKF